MRCTVLQYAVLRCRVLQCVVVCCSVLQCVASLVIQDGTCFTDVYVAVCCSMV